ncbi:TIGR03905 family TSCPD domain-containing protein [Clostridium neonatale]|uniref:ribonucleoside-diphosphate reductase n=1 Tax=Clostridium neonatale TaxID=137838 RepID=A0AA86JYA5_9CLOT|nr:Conserved hypothetical protein [Clostridium neonatale]
MFTYKTSGVCSSKIDIEISNDIIQSVKFTGGCNGNLSGIGQLVKGMKVDDVIDRLNGVLCGNKSTSCPDQLSKALAAWKKKIYNYSLQK